MTQPVASTKRLKHPHRHQDFHYKCVVVGDGGVGKTSMLLRFVQGTFLTEYEPTDYDTFTGKSARLLFTLLLCDVLGERLS